jgi:hypothetical protein
MLTTGFKLFFGYCVAALTAAVVYGYTTGGHHVGPLTAGYKGGVGEHLGYATLAGTAAVAGAVAVVLVAFRDADPRAAAALLGTDHVPVQRPAQPSFWPIVAAFGVGTMLVGMVLHGAVFVAGAVILAVVLVEWMMQAWADRATGDPAANRELRNRIMHPIEVPIGAILAIVLVPLAMSRIFIALTELGAVVAAGVLSAVVLAVATVFATRPRVSKNALAAAVVIGGVAMVAAGIIATAVGERDIEPHHGHGVTETHGTES